MTTITKADIRKLGHLCTRDEQGRHFYESHDDAWLDRMEEAGMISIRRPVHGTGVPYSPEHHSVQVSQAVSACFDGDGNLVENWRDEIAAAH